MVTETRRRKQWLVSSPQYLEFSKLCEDEGWQECPHLPKKGSEAATKLDAFMARGLGDGVPFSRAQVNSKFAHWQDSLKSEKVVMELDEKNLLDTKGLLERLRTKSVYTTRGQATTFYGSQLKTPSSRSVIDDEASFNSFNDLRKRTIQSLNEVLRRGSDATGQMYAEKEETNFVWFQSEWLRLVKNKMDPAVTPDDMTQRRIEANGYSIGSEFVRQLHISIKSMRGGSEESSMAERANDILASCSDSPEELLPKNNLLKETLYYICGWLLHAADRRSMKAKQGSVLQRCLASLVQNVALSKEQANKLPTGKIERVQLYDKLRYASVEFFVLVASVEKVCDSILVARSIKIYGPSITSELAEILSQNTEVLRLAKKCFDKGFSITDSELLTVTKYLVTTYMRMRGKDYVRQILGMKTLSVGHRAQLKVLSNPALFRKMRKAIGRLHAISVAWKVTQCQRVTRQRFLQSQASCTCEW